MDRLAVELLNHIFFYACTDGGQTGCSLALVSKRIRVISRTARFYSVALFSSPSKIEQFLYAYHQERARASDMLPRVRHLWLSYDENGSGDSGMPTGAPPSPPTSPPTTRAEFLAAIQRRTQHWRSAQVNLDEQYNRVIPMLVREVAPDLYSLALNQSRWRSTTVVRCFFPRLRELTCIGGDPSFLPFSAVDADTDAAGSDARCAPLYPSLQRLHHILTPTCKAVNFLNWARHAPVLTHLRVSRLDFSPRSTLETLEHVISDMSANDYFQCLQEVIILPHPPPPPSAAESTACYVRFTHYLHELPERVRASLTVLPPMIKARPHQGVDAPKECIVNLRRLWVERINGGPGCWAAGPPAPSPPA
ncbi:hypothetical protein BC628DRAFT_1411598 [Trametes gibbosa]|nr:hypothetical protein BC628DRAFT_1411598 [Trametes gibbosa]